MKAPLSEYPRMIMVRDSFMSLNGIWEYAIRKDDRIPETFDGEILVPFSPESPLSLVNRFVAPDDYLIYRKRFTLPPRFNKGHVILHFGAIDQIATVFLNGIPIGYNEGGFLPFEVVLDSALQEDNELIVIVKDYSDQSFYSRGKQKMKRGQIWYTAQSGIYMPVWLESVPKDFISSLKITPLYDEAQVEIKVFSKSELTATILFNGEKYECPTNEAFLLPVPNFISWHPNNPHLYPFSVLLGEDRVESYFAMRKVAVEVAKDGHRRIFLNNEALFQTGLLDQGYFSDTHLTPPSDDALIKDIELAKEMGFNVLRKHIKIEWERFYYHCDRLGMLVWQDFVNGGEKYRPHVIHLPAVLNLHFKDTNYKLFRRSNAKGRMLFYLEAKNTIEHLYNYPSIILWTVFNEGWGQFDAQKLLAYVKRLDNTRLIDITSGWHDQKIGDFKSWHVYFRKYRHRNDKLKRATILSEFGGFSYKVRGHTFSDTNFGYKKYKDEASFTKAFKDLYETQIIPSVKKGLSAAIYTQLSDVEDELNGLVTYDRKVIKIDVNVVKKINEKLLKE